MKEKNVRVVSGVAIVVLVITNLYFIASKTEFRKRYDSLMENYQYVNGQLYDYKQKYDRSEHIEFTTFLPDYISVNCRIDYPSDYKLTAKQKCLIRFAIDKVLQDIDDFNK